MTAHGPRVKKSEVIWHRGTDDDIPCLIVTRNLVAVARVFPSGKWTVSVTLGTNFSLDSGSSKNLEIAKQQAEKALLSATDAVAQQLLDWTAKHRRGDAPKKKTNET